MLLKEFILFNKVYQKTYKQIISKQYMKKEGLEAVCIIIGTVIGAGVLGIPYVIAKAGFLIGLIQLVIIGLLVLFMNLFLVLNGSMRSGQNWPTAVIL